MTAVAPPPNFQPISRSGWSATNGAPNGLNSGGVDDVSRMFMPRKSAQRANSSSSIVSSASSNPTISAPSVQTNGVNPVGAADTAGWGRKKSTRGLWPPSKAEPIAGLSTARPQSIASSSSGPSAASAISALHTPSSMLPSQHGVQTPSQQNGGPRPQAQPEGTAILHLSPLNGTFERKTIAVPLYPEVVKIGRQTNTKTIPTPTNGYFDSKVLSRQHAEIWADRSGKIWIRDVKSSNGTFVNGHRLSQENRDSDPHELKEQDMLELGIDIVSEDQKTVVHHKVAAKVEHAGIYTNGANVLDINFSDLDPSVNGAMGPSLGQGAGQLRGRTGSQGSLAPNNRLASTPAGVAGGNMAPMGQQRPVSFWLQPITMEHVVKRLNSEIKQAKQQSLDLRRTSEYIESLLASEPKKEPSKPPSNPQLKVTPMKSDIKTRFSDPPAPPPQQPLPEKPDVAHVGNPMLQPILRRNDTERPKSNSSPARVDPAQQISSLVEALSTANKKYETQSARLKELEETILQERLARESAEERANRLEMELQAGRNESLASALPSDLDKEEVDHQANGAPKEPQHNVPVEQETEEDSASALEELNQRLQQRLEAMTAEMNEIRTQMEQYRQRAETAEEESVKDRKSLADMVEKIRREEAERVAKEATRKARRSSVGAPRETSVVNSAEANGQVQVRIAADELDAASDVHEPTFKVHVPNGAPVKTEQLPPGVEESPSPTLVITRRDQLMQSTPYATAVAVILVGMGLMAYFNGMSSLQKVER